VFQSKFLFGWTGSPELGNSVASTNLPVPSLIVINSTNFLHHIPDNAHLVEVLSSETLCHFLDRILAEEIQVRLKSTAPA
jgi:thioredoxin domain-containing protein 10